MMLHCLPLFSLLVLGGILTGSWLEFWNFVLFQWFCCRLAYHQSREGYVREWFLLAGVVPLSGWITRYIGGWYFTIHSRYLVNEINKPEKRARAAPKRTNFIKLFALNDSETYAAETLKEAIAYAHKETGVPIDELVDDPRELTDEELSTYAVNVADMDAGEPKRIVTYRRALEEMILSGQDFPAMFCSSEW